MEKSNICQNCFEDPVAHNDVCNDCTEVPNVPPISDEQLDAVLTEDDSSKDVTSPIVSNKGPFQDGEVLHKVYILCSKHETECEHPYACMDCTSCNFHAHHSAVVYTAEKAEELGLDLYRDPESDEFKQAFTNMETHVRHLKDLRDQAGTERKILVRIDKLGRGTTDLRAIASATIGDISIHGIRVMDGDKGINVLMPKVRTTTDGGEKVWSDSVRFKESALKRKIIAEVLDTYHLRIALNLD